MLITGKRLDILGDLTYSVLLCFPPNNPRFSAIEINVLSSRLVNSFRFINVSTQPDSRYVADMHSGSGDISNRSVFGI